MTGAYTNTGTPGVSDTRVLGRKGVDLKDRKTTQLACKTIYRQPNLKEKENAVTSATYGTLSGPTISA